MADKALRYIASELLNKLNMLSENNQLYLLKDKEGVSSVKEVLDMTCPQSPTTQVVEVEKNINFVTQEVWSPQGLLQF